VGAPQDHVLVDVTLRDLIDEESADERYVGRRRGRQGDPLPSRTPGSESPARCSARTAVHLGATFPLLTKSGVLAFPNRQIQDESRLRLRPSRNPWVLSMGVLLSRVPHQRR
jgi:hypothetical protein